jgi:hypothetical protein
VKEMMNFQFNFQQNNEPFCNPLVLKQVYQIYYFIAVLNMIREENHSQDILHDFFTKVTMILETIFSIIENNFHISLYRSWLFVITASITTTMHCHDYHGLVLPMLPMGMTGVEKIFIQAMGTIHKQLEHIYPTCQLSIVCSILSETSFSSLLLKWKRFYPDILISIWFHIHHFCDHMMMETYSQSDNNNNDHHHHHHHHSIWYPQLKESKNSLKAIEEHTLAMITIKCLSRSWIVNNVQTISNYEKEKLFHSLETIYLYFSEYSDNFHEDILTNATLALIIEEILKSFVDFLGK